MKIVLKADVQGSVEAVANALTKLSTETVGRQRHLDAASAASPSPTSAWRRRRRPSSIGFNVRPAGKAQQLAEQEGVDIKLYQVIYDAIDDVKKAMVGMLAPITREKVHGQGGGPPGLHHPEGGHHRRLLRHRGQDHAQGAAAAGARLGRHLHRQGRLAAPVQGRRLRGRAGLRVRPVDRGLQRRQGRRRHRGVRDRDDRRRRSRPTRATPSAS